MDIMPIRRKQSRSEPAAISSFVGTQIAARGVTEPWVLEAMATVPRHEFVDDDLEHYAYEDRPLPIGHGQTISQPFMVAFMAQAAELNPGDRVLEVGTGSGYGAAILAHRAAEVWTIERIKPLAEAARSRLESLGYDNIHVVEGDGTQGWQPAEPFDAIVVTAAGAIIPDALQDQLVDGGRLVIPVGGLRGEQRLLRVVRAGDGFVTSDLGGVRFVPLVGDDGA